MIESGKMVGVLKNCACSHGQTEEYVKSFLNGKSYQYGSEKLQTSILLVTGTTAVQAGLSDIIDIVYKKLQLVPEDFK